MTKAKKIRNISAAGLLAVPVLLSGCSLFGSQSSMDIDKPPADIEQQMLNMMNGPVSTNSGGEQTGPKTTVYLANDKGLLAPVSLGIPEAKDQDGLKQALSALVSGGAYSKYVPKGFAGVLPKGTEVQVTMDQEQKKAVVEFNGAFNQYNPQDERKILEAVVWTATGFPGVQKVELWVDGQRLTEMPQNGTPLNQPLTRSLGINLEKSGGASLTNSTPVTVYFSTVTPDGAYSYYVPVTRLVQPGQNKVNAALSELIAGPQQNDGLEMVMTDGTSVESVKTEKDGTVTVSLKDDMFEKNDPIPDELLQSVVLTVSENTNNAMVKIDMNGQTSITGITDNRDYSKPVSKPEYINEIPL
ncbi:GerMN domain-containing protein [Paenibacillus sp. VCA1]|uniref:GerMN domain-containing protein n=1 Tax=Paenibacillus sp. VCA1 TaxID=3039148 RepID=UPI002870D1D2|nr:GerMN domain-containing protein [Paenibacillus sp. VCA1]MDR9857230.1 GerMN domain-containing protein [Paenibacillus sp. VCA1]